MLHKTKVIILSVFVTVIFILVFVFLYLFWFRYFFTDEFSTIKITYTGTEVKISDFPDMQKIKSATSIVGNFKNVSQEVCLVRVSSVSFSQEFSLKPDETFGAILPKEEKIDFTFCGEIGEINFSTVK